MAAVVVGIRLVDLEQKPFGRRVEDAVCANRVLDDLGVAVVVGVVHICVRAVGREREAEQAPWC